MKETTKIYKTGRGNPRPFRTGGMSLYAKIFALAALVFFVLGVSTLGAFNDTGKSVTVRSSSQTVSMAYRLVYEEGQSLSGVYVNVGTVYADAGGGRNNQTAQVRVRYYNDNSWNNFMGTTAYFANIYATNDSSYYKSEANYNWTALVTDGNVSREYIRISFTANRASVQVNEVAFTDAEGKTIKASVASEYCEGVSADEVKRTLDARNSFRASDDYRYRFTQNEEYILESINGIELGGRVNEGDRYVMSSDYNAFGLLVYALFTRIFGKSTFGLRLPSFLASFGLFVLLFFFGRQLFKSDKWGLVCSCLFGLNGLFFTVGRTGTPAALALFAVVAGIFFMYRFYAKGIDEAHPVKTALPVLFSGLCSAAAFCIHSLSLFPCAITLVVFVLGLVRMYRQRGYRIAKVVRGSGVQGAAESTNAAEEEKEETAKKVRRIEAGYRYNLRLVSAFFVCSFLLFAFLLLALSGAVANPAFVRYYGESGYFALLGKGIAQCFSVGDVTSYTAGNAVTPWGWFIALKGATVFDKSVAGEEATVLQVNVQANVVVSYAALLSFLFCTVFVIARVFSGKGKDKRFKAACRAYVGLFIGMAASFLPYLFAENVSASESYAFYLFYASFIALAFFILEGNRQKPTASGKRGAAVLNGSGVLLICLFVLFVSVFALTAPMCFGWRVSAEAASVLFNWTSALSNGYYGLAPIG